MPTLLLVDDEPVDRELAARCLRPVPDLSILHAGDGREALDVLSRSLVDVVLTDLRMPRMDGLELVQQLQTVHPLVPVILMTSQGSEQIAVRALKSGAASYVPKQEIKGTLASTVEQVLEVAEARRGRGQVLSWLLHEQMEFSLPNDPALLLPLVGYLHEGLDRVGFGDPGMRNQVAIALMEALSNGMIHGNLEVSSALRLDDPGGYNRMIESRRDEPPYRDRRLFCTARHSTRRVEYVVRDQGRGFNTSRLPDPTAPENLLAVSGRGILLIRTFMDGVAYNESGNQVILVKDAVPAPDVKHASTTPAST